MMGILFLIFLVLKIAGLVTWSWWIVFSPLLLVLAIFVSGALLGFGALVGADRALRGVVRGRSK